MSARWSLVLTTLLAVVAIVRPAWAVVDVELSGRIVSLDRSALTLDADGVRLTLDVSEIDRGFLGSLRVGDDVRVAAFRLGDGSLYVYGLFLQARDAPAERRKPPPDEGE